MRNACRRAPTLPAYEAPALAVWAPGFRIEVARCSLACRMPREASTCSFRRWVNCRLDFAHSGLSADELPAAFQYLPLEVGPAAVLL